MICVKIVLFVLTTQIWNFACSDANCKGENCTDNIEVTIIDRIKAPLKADFDITELSQQLRNLVKVEVQQSVKRAVKAEVKNIIENNIKEAEHKLIANITNAASEMKDYLKDRATESSTELANWKNETEIKIDSATKSITELDHWTKHTDEKMEKFLSDLGVGIQKTEDKIDSTNNSIKELYSWKRITDNKYDSTTKSIAEIKNWKLETDKKYDSAVKSINEMRESNKYVALTSCAYDITKVSNQSIIKFSDLWSSYGITNPSDFTSSGVFTCEYSGLYMVSVTILSRTQDANYRIMKNLQIINNGKVSFVIDQKKDSYHSGTSMVVVHLNRDDRISVKACIDFEIFQRFSCITIIKIK